MKLNLAYIAILAAAVLSLTACSGEEGGAALPAESLPFTSTAPSQPSSGPLTPDEGAEAPTTALEPCSLLSADDLAEFGDFKDGVQNDGGGARGCEYDRKIENASDDADVVGLLIRDTQGVDEVQDLGDGVQTGSVESGRKAVQTSGNGSCIIALAVGENSRVDAGAVAGTEERACQIADAVAAIIEPKLPEG
jgi:hypothetical protein